MKQTLYLALILFFNSSILNSACSFKNIECKCDTTKVIKIILNDNYLRISKYDTSTFAPDSFYTLSAKENRLLWFRDIESPDPTKFTTYWNDYVSKNYHANNKDFIDYYDSNSEAELAFQFGPGGMMWSYHSFVIKKVECCYLVTHSVFTHARFRYKEYAIIDAFELQKIRNLLVPFDTTSIPLKDEYGNHGYFIDKPYNKKFFINFKKQVDASNEPTKELMRFYNFLDDSLKMKTTYDF